MNMYNRFAYLYDKLMEDFDYENWFKYIQDIFKKYEKDPGKILEMACGTGNLSYYLGKEGYKLTCFDISEEMLSLAYNKLLDFPNVRVFRQNMVDFRLGEKFDSVISVCDSINYILEDKDLYNTFKNVWNHLEEGGIFIFDINSYYKLEEFIGSNIFIEDRDNIFYIWENYFNKEEEIANFHLTFFVKEDEVYTRFNEEHRQRAYRIDRLVKVLEEVGFSQLDYFKGFTFTRPETKTKRINFVAIK